MPFVEMAPEFNPGELFSKYLQLRPDEANEPSSPLFLVSKCLTKKHASKVSDPFFELFAAKRPIGKNHVGIMCRR